MNYHDFFPWFPELNIFAFSPVILFIMSFRNLLLRNPSLFIPLLFLSVSCSRHITWKNPNPGIDNTNKEVYRKDIFWLASDSLLGRDTPSPGLDSAAGYIMRIFRSVGIQPLNGSYFQEFSMCYKVLGDSNKFEIRKRDSVFTLAIKTGFVPYEFSGDTTVKAMPVFVGYGITAQEYNYDDFQNLDVKGKIVVLFRHEPREDDSTTKVFDGRRPTKYSNLKEKIRMAVAHGAIGMVLLSEPVNHISLKPRGFPWPSLSKIIPKDAGPAGFCNEREDNIPVVQAGEEFIRIFFGSVDSLKHLQKEIDRSLMPHSFAFSGTTMTLRTDVKKQNKYTTRNVAGMFRGSDTKKKNEWIVVGAHYDHVGFLKVHKADTDYIFNGADDNASGTCGVLSIARAFASLETRPERNILFILFAGEEKGLFGSAYYTQKPLVPLENTVAMLNLDMISRNAPGSLEIIGGKDIPDLASVIKKANRNLGFTLTMKRMSGGSDHWNFYRKKIPSVLFFSGFHKDYHTVYDNPDRVDIEKATRVSRLAFLTAWLLANDKHHYKIKALHDEDE